MYFFALLGLHCCTWAFPSGREQRILWLWCLGFALQWLLLQQSMVSRALGFSSCSTWAQWLWPLQLRARTQQLWHPGLTATWHVGSSWMRDQTHVVDSFTEPPRKPPKIWNFIELHGLIVSGLHSTSYILCMAQCNLKMQTDY